MHRTLPLLTALLLAPLASLHAEDSNPLSTAKYRWDMSADSAGALTIKSAVKLGIALTGDELAASLARGGDGLVARFEGGRLLAGDTTPVLKGLKNFTLYLRLKSEGEGLHGTVLAQRQPGRQDSGGFDVSGWHMPFIERQHFGFQGMFEGGLPPNAAAWSPVINVDLDQHPVPASKWRDVVVRMAKGGPLRLYLDGRLVMERHKPSAVPGIDARAMSGAASPLCIGSAPDGAEPFRGWVDEVVLWDRALDDSELQKLGGVSEIVNVAKPRGDRVFGTGVLTPATTAAQRYDWIDARLPAFREHLEKSDPQFPRYHLTLPGEQWNRIGFFHKGKHHLFFGWTTGGCFRYFDDALENIVWQHLVSDDLIHWTILPMPIRSPQWPNENGTFFLNNAGEVVTFYYGDRGIEPRMAVSRDADLVKWEAFPDRVRFTGVPDEFKTRHDPSAVFKIGGTWHLVCTTVRPQAKAMGLPLYKSKDAIHWEYAGKFFEDATGRSINECGQLFRLGGRDVFTSIHPLTRNTTYMTGHLREDGTFARETGGVPDLFSLGYNDVSSTVDDAGRVTMWRFCNVVRGFRDDSAAGWRNTYSLSRDVRLAPDGRLLFRPADALEKLRGQHFRPLTEMNAAQCEVRMQFIAAEKGETGVRLTDGQTQLDAYYDHAKRELVLDTTAMSKALCFRSGIVYRGPLRVKPGESVTLRFFSDRSVFELYANDESVISGAFFFHHPDKLKAAAMHRKGSPISITVDGWEMQPLKWSVSQSQSKANP
jgi:sucrose-6-phosphate hydrolase SacC (GH32 family)